ncbi:hypothetical protein M758_10G058200 [Ceratodon purpureus]|nr:hypothetical protein M758_10G058200 [Ceratodon purpureus]
MSRMAGRGIRPLLQLGSVVFFLVLVQQGQRASDRFSGGGNLEVNGGGRRLLAVEGDSYLGYRSREWKQTAGNRRVTEGELRSEPVDVGNQTADVKQTFTACENVNTHVGYADSCSYVRANPECRSGTMIEYVERFYCTFGKAPLIGYGVYLVWLMALFYMLGNTAADFFCPSLEKLSKLLHLPPTVAGVSLLPLGNGAPDVFASIAAFTGSSNGQVGLNSVLGGAMFVTSVVAGSVALVVSSVHGAGTLNLDRNCFLRDVGFFMVTLVSLLLIIIVGKIHLWGAIMYISIYLVYGFMVAAGECIKTQDRKKRQSSYALEPLLLSSSQAEEEGSGSFGEESVMENTLPQWMWTSNVAIYSHKGLATLEGSSRPLWGWSEQEEAELQAQKSLRRICWHLLWMPLNLPRRLTIPLVDDSRWSRPFAIGSAVLAPTLLAAVWDGNDGHPLGSSPTVYIFGLTLGALLGILSAFTTKSEHPPRRFLFPWAFGGFIMSIVWFYLIANELVAALVALGVILEIDAAILGLTVLAWGNSIGDLMSNIALSFNGNDGVQIAVSGCYAGPMFNTLVGLGLSFLFASWKSYPAAFVIPTDYSLFYTIGFLYVGLLWAMLTLPTRAMTPSKGFGIGLLVLYGTFLSLRLANVTGLISLPGLENDSGPSLHTR